MAIIDHLKKNLINEIIIVFLQYIVILFFILQCCAFLSFEVAYLFIGVCVYKNGR